MAKFIISTDSCVDRFRSYLDANNVYYIILRRITGEEVSAELYDSYPEYEAFYESIKKGALPTTSQLNPAELEEHFSNIFQKEAEGDIIHISLSGGLSNTYNNCASAAAAVTEASGRKVYAIDSLSASAGIGMMVDRLIELRDSGASAEEAVAAIEKLRDHQQVWAVVSNLFHLKRGGRISGIKAAMGTLLNVRPVLIINKEGKLVIEKTVKGTKKSVEYVMSRLVELGVEQGVDYTKSKVYIVGSDLAEMPMLREELEKYIPKEQIVEGMIGPIIGTHVGAGAFALVYEGAERIQ